MNIRWLSVSCVRRLPAARGLALTMVLLLSGFYAGCTPTSPAVVVVGSGYDIQAHTANAWASINQVNPLDRLSLSTWQKLVKDGRVSTDNTGVAELRNTSINCFGLYVFRQSGMQFGACTSGAAGNWNCVVGAAAATNCAVGLASPSTNVTHNGTWVSLISLDQGQLSIVTVLDGGVDVVPVTNLVISQFEKTDNTFVIDLAVRDLDDNQTVHLNKGESTYTAPDAYLQQLRSRFNLPPARTPLGPDQLQLLVNALAPAYPALQLNLEDVRLRAQDDGLVFPAVLTSQPAVNVLLEGAGGFLNDSNLQQVVLLGVNWNLAQQDAFPAQTVNLSLQLPGRGGLVTDLGYNLDVAQRLSKDGNLGTQTVTLIIPTGDNELQVVAKYMVDGFKAMGIGMVTEQMNPADVPAKLKVNEAAGIPTLALERR